MEDLINLDDKVETYFEATGLIKTQIEKLKEFRVALIYSAVTGKIEI